MTEKSYNRRGIFARFKAPGGLLDETSDEYTTFGLFVEKKTGITSPFDIEDVLEAFYGIATCADFETRQLCTLLGDYEKWKERREV